MIDESLGGIGGAWRGSSQDRLGIGVGVGIGIGMDMGSRSESEINKK